MQSYNVDCHHASVGTAGWRVSARELVQGRSRDQEYQKGPRKRAGYLCLVFFIIGFIIESRNERGTPNTAFTFTLLRECAGRCCAAATAPDSGALMVAIHTLLPLAITWFSKPPPRPPPPPPPSAFEDLTFVIALMLLMALPMILHSVVGGIDYVTTVAECQVGPVHSGEETSSCHGRVTLTQKGSYCVVYYDIHGLKPGLHGFHIHEKVRSYP